MINNALLGVFFLIATSLYAVNSANCPGGQNEWDGPLLIECSPGQAVTHMQSYHSNHYEDRCFKFECSNIGADTTDCSWSGWANSWDGVMDFKCGTNQLMTGVFSYHLNQYEDRRWRFRCCKVSGYVTSGCTQTDYINAYDGFMDYNTPAGKFFDGMYSVHSNHHEDRRYKVKYCGLTKVSDMLRGKKLLEKLTF